MSLLARLWRDQGKTRQARGEWLAPVYGWFSEGFDTRDFEGGESTARRNSASFVGYCRVVLARLPGNCTSQTSRDVWRESATRALIGRISDGAKRRF